MKATIQIGPDEKPVEPSAAVTAEPVFGRA
jgi:hypothetical protein